MVYNSFLPSSFSLVGYRVIRFQGQKNKKPTNQKKKKKKQPSIIMCIFDQANNISNRLFMTTGSSKTSPFWCESFCFYRRHQVYYSMLFINLRNPGTRQVNVVTYISCNTSPLRLFYTLLYPKCSFWRLLPLFSQTGFSCLELMFSWNQSTPTVRLLRLPGHAK